ncbi:MAG TPA: protein kinase [Candidatus Eisenbacteria bacterium]|nr:protein kinase [Candidatus Eisenbacteria bacterium]
MASLPIRSGVYSGRVESYTLADLRFGLRLAATPKTSLTVTAENLFDERHQDLVGSAEAGRLLLGRIGVGFQPPSGPRLLLRMSEQRYSHYRILHQIGSGGMGVVYLARDEHLHCDVALKVLPAGTLADDIARRRFRQEALSIARRAHRNLVAVRDFDTQDGVDFLVMENVEGEGLDQTLKKGSLDEATILNLGAQLASGLAAAHGAGVLHRDIKPSNLKVTPDGDLKILDFGLAKFRAMSDDTASVSTITETGHVVGTLPYLAPEVLLGSPASERSDIYSAGVVLYEMASGRRPHLAEDASTLIQEIVSQQAPPPSRWNRRISSALEAVILKAIDKDPSRRYPSAMDLEVDLRRAGTSSQIYPPPAESPRRKWIRRAALAIASVLVILLVIYREYVRDWIFPPPAVASLAVLPLRSSSADPSQDYFADGMTDELITTLSGIAGLSVISRTSAMNFKKSGKTLRQIARELDVRWIVEGSVVREDSLVRINASLVDAAHDKSHWARRYEGTLNDVLSLQAELARAIAQDVNVALTPTEEARLRKRGPVQPGAMDAFLHGHFHWNRRQGPDVEQALLYYGRSIELDSRFARPHAELADVYGFLGNLGKIPQESAYRAAKGHVLRALQLEPDLGEAHASVAVLKMEFEWDWPGAEREFQRAIELNPGYATGRQWYAEYLARMGRNTEAVSEISRAVELDPLSAPVAGMVGTVQYYGRKYDLAIESYRQALRLNQGQVLARFYLGLALLANGATAEAVTELERADGESRGIPLMRAGLGYAYAVAGRRREAERVYQELRARSGVPVAPSLLALVAVGLESNDAAFRHLEDGFARQDSYLGHLKVLPVVDPLRGDPRFTDLLRRLKLT